MGLAVVGYCSVSIGIGSGRQLAAWDVLVASDGEGWSGLISACPIGLIGHRQMSAPLPITKYLHTPFTLQIVRFGQCLRASVVASHRSNRKESQKQQVLDDSAERHGCNFIGIRAAEQSMARAAWTTHPRG